MLMRLLLVGGLLLDLLHVKSFVYSLVLLWLHVGCTVRGGAIEMVVTPLLPLGGCLSPRCQWMPEGGSPVGPEVGITPHDMDGHHLLHVPAVSGIRHWETPLQSAVKSGGCRGPRREAISRRGLTHETGAMGPCFFIFIEACKKETERDRGLATMNTLMG